MHHSPALPASSTGMVPSSRATERFFLVRYVDDQAHFYVSARRESIEFPDAFLFKTYGAAARARRLTSRHSDWSIELSESEAV